MTTKDGTQGIKAWYWVKKGCQGAEERVLNDPYVFFDARPKGNNVLIEFFEGQMDEVFDTIVFTFQFVKPGEYGD